MCAIKQILLVFTVLMLLSSISIASSVDNAVYKDATKYTFKDVKNAPGHLKGTIQITDVNTESYNITDKGTYISIRKQEQKDQHTKANIKIKSTQLSKLKGFNGKEIVIANLVNGTLENYRVIKIKDHTHGDSVIVPVSFSEIVISGMTGKYIKTVSVSPINEIIDFNVINATGLYVKTNVTVPFIEFDKTNISTYPDSNSWVLVWPMNSNAMDISGNNRNGTIVGANNTSDRHGVENSSFYFDGDNDYITHDLLNISSSSNTLLIGYMLNNSTSNHAIADFRNSTGYGRTGIYDYEQRFYINNNTYLSTLNSSAYNGWGYASYPFTGTNLLSYFTLGARYNINFEYLGWMDLVGLYNGTLSASDRRVFSYGYSGIKAKTSTGSLVELSSNNTSISSEPTIDYVEIKSNNDSMIEVTLEAPFQEDYTVVREWDNSSTNHRIDITYIPLNNVSEGNLSYNLSKSYLYSTPVLESNDTSANISTANDIIDINTSNLSAGTAHYYNISIPIIQQSIESAYPVNTTISMTVGETQSFNITSSGITDQYWYIDDELIQENSSTNNSSFTFIPITSGTYTILSSVPSNTSTWTVTVIPYDELLIKSITPTTNTSMFEGRFESYSTWMSKGASVDWYINGTIVQHRIADNLSYPQLYGDVFSTNTTLVPGTYNVTVHVSDDLYSLSRTWYLTVYDTSPALFGLVFTAFFATAFAFLRKRR